MKIISIEERAYAYMGEVFRKNVKELTELCGEPDENKRWLKNEDVCRLLNIKKRTLQYYRDSGKLAFSRIGNKCYYKVADVEKLINNSLIK